MSPRSWTSLPSPCPSYASRLSQGPCLGSLSHTADSHWLCILHMLYPFLFWGFTLFLVDLQKLLVFPRLLFVVLVAKLCPTLLRHARQTTLAMGFHRWESWSGLPFPSPGDLPGPGIKPTFPCIGRWILYHWATWGAHCLDSSPLNIVSVPILSFVSNFILWCPSLKFSVWHNKMKNFFAYALCFWLKKSFRNSVAQSYSPVLCTTNFIVFL